MAVGSPKRSIRSASFSTVVGMLTGPLEKAATIAAVLSVAVSTLPIVRSTSLTKIPGDAKLMGIFYSPNLRFILKLFIKKGIFNGKTVREHYQSGYIQSVNILFFFLFSTILLMVHILHS